MTFFKISSIKTGSAEALGTARPAENETHLSDVSNVRSPSDDLAVEAESASRSRIWRAFAEAMVETLSDMVEGRRDCFRSQEA